MEKSGQVEASGLNSVIQAMRLVPRNPEKQQLFIANAATAAAIRRVIADRKDVEVIISNAVETCVAYQVVDEDIKSRILAGIEKRGLNHE